MLKPPVGNAGLRGWRVPGHDRGRPNSRTDYHCEPGEELFYQLKGDITLKVIEDGVPRDVTIHEGDIFLLPADTMHSPRRPAGTLGMVVERQRPEDEEESITWYCDNCGNMLYQFNGVITDLGTQLKPVMERSGPTLTCTPARSAARSCRRRRRRRSESFVPLDRIDVHTHILPPAWPDQRPASATAAGRS